MMKLILSSLLAMVSSQIIAQNRCDLAHVVFHSPKGKRPQPIMNLGNNPQIKCLRGITDSHSFFNSLKTCLTKDIYKADFTELDDIFKQIGFKNGLSDENFTEQNLKYETIPYGTKGMLGFKKDKKIGYVYAQLVPQNHGGVQGWKVSGPTGCYIYIFTKCGNAFYPQSDCPECPCIDVQLDIRTDEKHIDIQSGKVQDTVITNYFVYCIKKITRQTQRQQGKSLRTSSRSKVFGLLYTDTTIVNGFSSTAVSYNISTAYTESLKVCKDTTVDLKLKLIAKQASSEQHDNDHFVNNEIPDKKIITRTGHKIIIRAEQLVDDKAFNALKPLLKAM
jgi:hypothetical protein